MYVFGVLRLSQLWSDQCKQVVNIDTMFFSSLVPRLHLFLNRGFHCWSLFPISGDRCRAGPNQRGARFLHSFHNGFQTRFIIGSRGTTVMNAKIEMEHIPVAFTQPGIELLQRCSSRPTIGGGAIARSPCLLMLCVLPLYNPAKPNHRPG